MGNQHYTKVRDIPVRRARYFWLDWIRFVSALLVVIQHCRGTNWVEWGLLVPGSRSPLAFAGFAVARLGYEAVIVFFVLSGFLVGGKTAERIWTRSFDFHAYAIDRISRIYVPLVPALILTALAGLFSGQDLQIGQLAISMVGLQEVVALSPQINQPLWSLAYEMWFYVAAGACGYLVGRASTRRLSVFLVLLVCMTLFTRLSPTYLFCWLIGALAYGIRLRRSRISALAGGLAVLLAVAISQFSSISKEWVFPGYWDPIFVRQLSYIALAAGAAVVIASVSRTAPNSPLVEKFERLGTPLASFSYTLYLTHSPTLALWEKFKPARYDSISVAAVGAFVGEVLTCLVVAFLMYLLFESHTAQVRRWLSKQRAFWIAPTTEPRPLT